VDIRKYLFNGIEDTLFSFEIVTTEKGIFAGSERLTQVARELGIQEVWVAKDGYHIVEETIVFKGVGCPAKVVAAEDVLLGLIGKSSGVATSAYRFVRKAKNRVRIVCGAWKKVSAENKTELRRAIAIGGAGLRITEKPFVYLDKNYIKMIGGISRAVKKATAAFNESTIVTQLHGQYGSIKEEAREAVAVGAGIIMVDTGNIEDLRAVVCAGKTDGWLAVTKIAYAGGVKFRDIESLVEAGADIVAVGRAIIDAPLLDFRLDVLYGE